MNHQTEIKGDLELGESTMLAACLFLDLICNVKSGGVCFASWLACSWILSLLQVIREQLAVFCRQSRKKIPTSQSTCGDMGKYCWQDEHRAMGATKRDMPSNTSGDSAS